MTDWPDAWLSRDPLPDDPVAILATWLEEAFAAGTPPSPHAFALATNGRDGDPAVRFVLCQAVEADTGSLVFYTNRESHKGLELAARPRAAAAFHFVGQGRQARVVGPVAHTSDAESDAYFATRPVDAQVVVPVGEVQRAMLDPLVAQQVVPQLGPERTVGVDRAAVGAGDDEAEQRDRAVLAVVDLVEVRAVRVDVDRWYAPPRNATEGAPYNPKANG